MMTKEIHIRPATMEDAPAISAVHCSNVASWKRWGADGSARPARYADLTLYQRWLNGGAWMDVETCAYHLRRLLSGGGFALAAELNGRVLGEAEAYVADEPPPYGRNLNLATLYVHRNHQRQGLGSALMCAALDLAESERCDTFTVAHAEVPGFYARHGLHLAERWTRLQLPARAGKIRYLTDPLPDEAYESVRGWALPVGRYQNAHHDWERARPNAVPDFEEWRGLRLERCWIRVDRHRAALIFEESPHRPGAANTFLFTPTGPSPDLFSAVRDLAARRGFLYLHCFVRSNLKLPQATATGYTQQLFMRHLSPPHLR